MALSTSAVLLIAYISSETLRANFAYYAFHSYPEISASIITLLSETVKFLISIFFLLRKCDDPSIETVRQWFRGISKGDGVDSRRMGRYALPAGLYLINNLIYYAVLPLTTPSLLQVCVLAKLPTTGIMHHFMIKPQKNILAWISLLFLCVGLAVFNVPSGNSASSKDSVGAWYLAPVAGFVIACLSALASISTEKSTKEAGFWESQAYLYSWGIVFSAMSYPLIPSTAGTRTADTNPQYSFQMASSATGLIIITAGTGLVVAVILRAKDNILKVIGTAASLVTIAASQFFLLPGLRASTFTPWKVCGGGIVTMSTWCYNHCQQQPSVPRNEKDLEGDSSMAALLPETEKDRQWGREFLFHPTVDKLVGGVIITAFLTYEVALRGGA